MSPQGRIPVNRLMAALPGNSRARDQCELVRLSSGDILAEPGGRIRTVHFPAGGLISLIAVVEDDNSLEVALIGAEGVVGVPLMLGAITSSKRALVQLSGAAWRMGAGDFRRAVLDHAPLRRGIDRYLRTLIAELGRNAACIRFHLLEARLARRLLIAQDRSPNEDIYLTHGVLAKILGVRRSGVTMAAVKLQRRRLILYSRGGITILDRKGLEQAACSCYRGIPKTATDTEASVRLRVFARRDKQRVPLR